MPRDSFGWRGPLQAFGFSGFSDGPERFWMRSQGRFRYLRNSGIDEPTHCYKRKIGIDGRAELTQG